MGAGDGIDGIAGRGEGIIGLGFAEGGAEGKTATAPGIGGLGGPVGGPAGRGCSLTGAAGAAGPGLGGRGAAVSVEGEDIAGRGGPATGAGADEPEGIEGLGGLGGPDISDEQGKLLRQAIVLNGKSKVGRFYKLNDAVGLEPRFEKPPESE